VTQLSMLARDRPKQSFPIRLGIEPRIKRLDRSFFYTHDESVAESFFSRLRGQTGTQQVAFLRRCDRFRCESYRSLLEDISGRPRHEQYHRRMAIRIPYAFRNGAVVHITDV